jgi:multisubunit Na+/H+ antiporter MnhG subunit
VGNQASYDGASPPRATKGTDLALLLIILGIILAVLVHYGLGLALILIGLLLLVLPRL